MPTSQATKPPEANAPESPKPGSVGPVDVDPNDPRLTKKLLARFVWIKARRRELDRESRSLETEEKIYRDAVFSWLEARGVTERKLHGYRITRALGRLCVPWKMHLIKHLGAAEASKIEAAAPRSETLEIVRLESADV